MKDKLKKIISFTTLSLVIAPVTYGAIVKTVELDATAVSSKSFKFGEYNGMNESNINGHFDILGGNAFDQAGGLKLWGIQGSDLGTTSRNLNGFVGDQGKWKFSANYDELRHNISDSYQTPQDGKMGGNVFTLPTNFGTIDGNSSPSGRQMNATQLAAFKKVPIYSGRKDSSFSGSYVIGPKLNMQYEFSHLKQSGAKLTGANAQGNVLLGGTGTIYVRAEALNIIPYPTSYTTNTFNLGLNWLGENGHLSSSYYGSVFRNEFNSVSWQTNFATGASACTGTACFVTDIMGTAPNNDFHQLNLIGAYRFTPTTKISGGLSYGRSTQNDWYAPAVMQANGLPQASLEGRIIDTHGNFKLTNQTTEDLTLSAGLKYNQRNNQSSSKTYSYRATDGTSNYSSVNMPFSNKKTQLELAADYHLAKSQNMRLTYEREAMERWCSVNTGLPCVASPSSIDHKFGLTYKIKPVSTVKVSTGYNYIVRKSDFDHNFLSPIASNTGSPLGGINAKDVKGFISHIYAGRKQHMIKAASNWQTTENLALDLEGRYSKDNYDSDFGVQDAHSNFFNFEANYSFDDNFNLGWYSTWKNSVRNMLNGLNGTVGAAPTSYWFNKLVDDSKSIGLNLQYKKTIFGKKMELLGDLSYSNDKTMYTTQSPNVSTCAAKSSLTCGDVPDIKTEVITFKLTDQYQLTKESRVALGYIFEKRVSMDPYYNGYRYGYTPNRMMPTNEEVPQYTISMITASYSYTF